MAPSQTIYRILLASGVGLCFCLFRSPAARADGDFCMEINRQIAALPQAGGTIRIANGIHECSTPIVIDRSNVNLLGASSALDTEDDPSLHPTLRLKPASDSPLILIGKSGSGTSIANVAVENIELDGNAGNQTPRHECGKKTACGCLTIGRASDVRIFGVDLHDSAANGIVAEGGASRLQLKYVHSHNNSLNGLESHGTTESYFEGMELSDNGRAGLSADSDFDRNSIIKSRINRNATQGIRMFSSSGNTFDDLMIADTAREGVFVSGGSRDNTFQYLRIQRAGLSAFVSGDDKSARNILKESLIVVNPRKTPKLALSGVVAKRKGLLEEVNVRTITEDPDCADCAGSRVDESPSVPADWNDLMKTIGRLGDSPSRRLKVP